MAHHGILESGYKIRIPQDDDISLCYPAGCGSGSHEALSRFAVGLLKRHAMSSRRRAYLHTCTHQIYQRNVYPAMSKQ
jgi:hypothetical protein